MIKHGYRLELTCDCLQCKGKKEHRTFTGMSLNGTKTVARESGWRMSANMTRAYAPGHFFPYGKYMKSGA